MGYSLNKHGSVRPVWRTNENEAPPRRIGVEFEIENQLGYQHILNAIPDTDDPAELPVTERDGSLIEGQGVEIVFPPFKHSQLKSAESFFGRTLKAIEDAGAESNVRCGMHMNVSTAGWSDATKCAFLFFLNTVNVKYLKAIGGRALNGYCSQQKVRFDDNIYLTDHMICAGLRPNRIEVRFPQATMDMEKMALNVDFLDLLQDWAADEAEQNWCRGVDYYYCDVTIKDRFLTFLRTHKRKAKKAARITEVFNNA
jgi:hypothetical protein